MIEAIEDVMRHWGEQQRKCGPSGGLASPMGALIQYGGPAPRGGVSGHRVLLAGAGVDYLASEVAAAVAAVERDAEDGVLLAKLARKRYLPCPALALRDQLYDLELKVSDAGERMYLRLVHRLHELVAAELKARHQRSAAQLAAAKREGDRLRKASVQQAAKAHSRRGAELHGAKKA
ncbi:hypothetical protein ACX1DW_15735 [Stutzerimonas sp. KH-1]|jgi:hypothetical protein